MFSLSGSARGGDGGDLYRLVPTLGSGELRTKQDVAEMGWRRNQIFLVVAGFK